ncbi:hypothetical protein [Burkholderia territorii]|nr:hypothetical protein [Burkholderia territorii]
MKKIALIMLASLFTLGAYTQANAEMPHHHHHHRHHHAHTQG